MGLSYISSEILPTLCICWFHFLQGTVSDTTCIGLGGCLGKRFSGNKEKQPKEASENWRHNFWNAELLFEQHGNDK